MTKKIYSISAIALILLFCGSLAAQVRDFKVQPLDMDVVTFPAETMQKTQTHLYVWVRNRDLQFLKSDSVYMARYQISLGINEQENVSLLTKDTTAVLTENQYSSTIDPNIQHVHHFVFQLSPKEYVFKVRLLDLNSKSSHDQEIKKKIDAFDPQKLALSDMLFITKNSIDSLSIEDVIMPTRVLIQDDIYLYSEIVSPENCKEFMLDLSLSQEGSTKVLFSSHRILRRSTITPVLVHLPITDINRGETELKLQVRSNQLTAEKIKNAGFISVREKLSGLALKDEVEPLVYITNRDDWNKIHKAEGEEREQLLKAFWNLRDPSAGMGENELFNEFYKRVDFVNLTYGHDRIPGWKTDRGHVYIIYGAPDSIERSTPSAYSQGEYEIWYYTSINKKFVFLDERGFGDYVLVSGTI
jgi:GWxTD domain-containing protein